METVEVLRALMVEDPFSGEEVSEDWSSPITFEVEGCIIEPRTTAEPLEAGRAAVVVGYTIHMPYDTDITAKDRVRLFDEVWNVDGYPFKWKNPFTGHKAGIEVSLKKVSG